MNPRSWSHVLDLFREAIELDPRERRRFLDERCDDAQARDAVERMIAADGLREGPLDMPPAVSVASLADRTAPGLGLGDSVGAYRVLRVIASGGMSTVYEAEQERPRRRVALKTLRPGFLIGSVLGRFRLEAEVLGSLQHPGVARVYESGVHDASGTPVPFIAMELVEGGRDLLSHGRTLERRARLALFLEVCDAVHHAHQKGVIHRDLKPSNVLVDARGTVKVIDFGLARVSDRERFRLSFGPTETGRAAGTLLYMSPEQLAGRRDAIDVRCDVYALGVLLFELLGGRHPFEVEGRSVAELARALEEAEPRRLGEVCAECRGDLEWIASRAMARERERRYPTVHELAGDVRRYLDHEPVVASPPSGWYRFRKLVRRHRFGFGLAASVGAVGLAGLGTTLWQMHVARVRTQERNVQLEIAGQASGFLQRAFTSIRPQAARGEQLTLAAFVDRTARTLELAPPQHPDVQASLRRTLGITYRALGRHEEALRHLERAHALTAAAHGPEDERTLGARNDLLEVRLQAEVTAELETQVDDALRRARGALGEEHDVARAALLNRVRFCFEAGRFEQAERLLHDCLPDFARSSDPDLYRTARLELAAALIKQGRVEQSATLFAELRRDSEARDELDPTRLVDEGNLITALVAAGRYEGVEELQRSLLERMRRVLGEEHPLTVGVMADYGHCLAREGRTHEALPWLERVRQACRASVGAELNSHVGALVSAGQAFVELGRLDPALEMLEAALAADEVQTEERSPRRPQAMLCIANVYRLRGEPELAEAWLVDGERSALEVLGPDHFVTLMLQNNLALVRVPREGRRQAIAVLERTAKRSAQLYGPDDAHQTLLFRYNLGSLLLEVGELERAEEILTDVRERRVRRLGEDHSDVLVTDQALAHLLWLSGQRRESERLQRSLLDRRLASSGEDHPHTVHAMQQYVGLLLSEGRDEEARPWQRRLEAAREALDPPAN